MTIFSIFRRPPPASILAFLQSDFACLSHGTGAILRRVFRQILGTFRGQKVHFSAILDHFFDFSRQFLLRFWVRNHKTTHQHMPNNFVFHHIPILGPKKYPPLIGLLCSKKNYCFRETHFRNAIVLVNTVVKSRFKTLDH